MTCLKVVGLAMVCSACGPSWFEVVRNKAAVDLRCDGAKIATRDAGPMGNQYVEAKGCGKANWYIESEDQAVSPLDRATFDLSCAKDQLITALLDPSTIGVSGCGHKAVYMAVRMQYGGKRWVLNSTDNQRHE